MSEELEIAEPAEYHIVLYFNVGQESVSRSYYNVSLADKNRIVSGWAYGSNVEFATRNNAMVYVNLSNVYELNISEAKKYA